MIPLTVPEVRRLILASAADDTQRVFHLGWSRWRRAHQAIAQRCHSVRRDREGTVLIAPPLAQATTLRDLTDAAWERVRSVLPPQRPRTGRPRHDHRTVLGGILWVLRTASPWREMPARFGKWNCAYVRYRLWRRQRIVDALGPADTSTLAVSAVIGGEVSL